MMIAIAPLQISNSSRNQEVGMETRAPLAPTLLSIATYIRPPATTKMRGITYPSPGKYLACHIPSTHSRYAQNFHVTLTARSRGDWAINPKFHADLSVNLPVCVKTRSNCRSCYKKCRNDQSVWHTFC